MFEKLFPALRRNDSKETGAGDPYVLMEKFWRDPSPFLGQEETLLKPSVDVLETGDEIVVTAEVPGIDPKEIELTLLDNNLRISGKKKIEKEEKKGNLLHRECRFGSFVRVIPLPSEVDASKTTAKSENGVLKICLPKSEKTKSRRVEIQG